MSHSLHLHQELSLDSPRSLVFTVRSVAAHRVDLIDKDDRRLFLPSHVKQRFDKLLALSDIFAHQVRGGNREEGPFCLSRTSFCEVSLPCSWRTI